MGNEPARAEVRRRDHAGNDALVVARWTSVHRPERHGRAGIPPAGREEKLTLSEVFDSTHELRGATEQQPAESWAQQQRPQKPDSSRPIHHTWAWSLASRPSDSREFL